MEILLNNDDLTFIDGLIKKMEFQAAYPLFQFFTNKIQETQQKQAENLKAVEAEVASEDAPKEAKKLKKA